MYLIFPQKNYILFFLVLISSFVHAQLSDFNFSVSVTEESCSGNGSITMEVSGLETEAQVTYKLFLYPDLDTPIAQTSSSMFSNLESGDYLVEATQTLDDFQNTQTADATIIDAITVLDFEVDQGYSGVCGDLILVVNILSGNAESFEIISGPVTVPLQTGNTFTNLPEGTYVIRVYDNCGNALTKTYTYLFNDSVLTVSEIEQSNVLINCDEVTIYQVISASNGSQLSYPIVVNFTINFSDGNETTSYSQTYDNGPETELEISTTVTDYAEQTFTVDTVIQDGCGTMVTSTEIVNPNPEINLSEVANVCGNDLIIAISNMLPPFTLQFIQAPIEFNPSDYNDNQGVYSDFVIVFGQEDEGLPFGVYEVSIVDACGNIGEASIELVEELEIPVVNTSNGGCDTESGALSVRIPNRELVSALITAAPINYSNAVPDDVSYLISSNGRLMLNDLPLGNYTLEMIDNCGNTYIEDFEIPEHEIYDFNVSTSVSCSTNLGALNLTGGNGTVASVIFIEAPVEFSQSLPYDYSYAISSQGIFYVEDLPAGNYTIEFTDSCGSQFMFTEIVETYNDDNNESIYVLQQNCGSFDLSILDNDDAVVNQTYWFQKYYPEYDSWGHPNTGVMYNEGELPTDINSISIENGESLLNIFVVGEFRLIKVFQTAVNPNPEAYCFDIFGEFEIESELTINDVFNLNCDGGSGPSDIIVDVSGVPPYNFSIISPIVIDNGAVNVFTDLSAGIYEIRVEDACGSIAATTINTMDLLPVVSLGNPTDMVICSDSNNNQALFNLTEQNTQLLGNQNPDNFTITYHLNQMDADSGNNPISENYENVINPQTVYVRMVHNTLDVCYETDAFQLIVGFAPELGADESTTICEGNSILLSADLGYSSYLWSSGETTRSIVADTEGTYSVTVFNNYGDFYCEATKTYTVVMSGVANIENIISEDFTSNNNFVDIEVSGIGDYEYSLDGVTYQLENHFENLDSGIYTIFVRDRNGCGVSTENISLLNYKKFFTPNGDGENEYWQITGSHLETDMQVFVYDRYGKLLINFSGNDIGWDGRYNGNQMPTSDYWFLVKRSNGLTHTGHFTLKR
ncbi:T9SS type B sorting domain-containing protein [Winogradskyella endarachnes]|uniref:T9SS type B sorting domain-containing protein n=1 Tax=Winogradskyella endarachnes TaxID=2681965 RepID=A0A6L6U7U1_9FLAO|nr:T9SS type B sorting domain-containing protein [Winogradskyella endarachnes]MUU78333.1 T9SS type B sorting domain-containing protein [Winogradskyella endarachnes]